MGSSFISCSKYYGYEMFRNAFFTFVGRRFERDAREMPVLWHQALLTFAQRYKSDISSDQRDALLALLRKQSHAKVTAEVRRELQHAKCRDVEVEPPEAME